MWYFIIFALEFKNRKFMRIFFKLMAVALILMTAFVACDKDNPNEPNNPSNPTDSLNDVGVKINGVTWATRNVDKPGTFAAKPEVPGMFYQWNRPIGWSATDPIVNSNDGTNWDNSMPAGYSWETNVCPSGWRIPTRSELQNLIYSGSSWSTLNGVNGYFFGNGNQKVFFPAAGSRSIGGTLICEGDVGYYWSSTRNGNDDAYILDFDHNIAEMRSYFRGYGLSIRCVKE